MDAEHEAFCVHYGVLLVEDQCGRRLGLSLCTFPPPQTKIRSNDLFRYRMFPLSPSGVRQAKESLEFSAGVCWLCLGRRI